MVGYDQSTSTTAHANAQSQQARRPGWEQAYIDYESLRSLLEEVEVLYQTSEEEAKRQIEPGFSASASFEKSKDVDDDVDVDVDVDTEHEALLRSAEDGGGGGGGGGISYEATNDINNLDSKLSPSEEMTEPAIDKAIEHSEHFLRSLRKQVEKVSLFALSRQGELADAVGSLRFNPYLTSGSDGDLSTLTRDRDRDPGLTIRHDSKGKNTGASSSSNGLGGGGSGGGKGTSGSYGSMNDCSGDTSVDNSNHSGRSTSSDNPSLFMDELSFLLPQISRVKASASAADRGGGKENSSLQFRESLDNAPRPMFTGKAILQRGFASEASFTTAVGMAIGIGASSSDASGKWKHDSFGNYVKASNSNEQTIDGSAVGGGMGMSMGLTSDVEVEMNDVNQDEENKPSSTLDPYTLIGVELLHLLRFICVNAMEVRKILKKYDNIIERYAIHSEFNNEELREDLNTHSPFVSSFSFHADEGPDVHLQQLTNSEAIAAITLSLLKASIKAAGSGSGLGSGPGFGNGTGTGDIRSMEQYLVHDETLLRFKCSIDCIDILREYANVVNQPFPAFLSRQAMIVAGYDLGGIEGMKQKALEVLLTFNPDTILFMDKLDLSEWQQRCWQYTFTSAGNKMRKTSFDLMDEKNVAGSGALQDRKLSWGGVDASSMTLNLMSILLYTINYYIVAPTAHTYAHHLGARRALGSTLIGASSFAALFSALLYSFWYSKFSYKSAFIFSSLCPIVGNALYAIALSKKSFRLALLGRVLVGFGSAEVLNRQLVSSCVHVTYMTKASVLFVVVGTLGMSIGPLLASILDTIAGRDYAIDFELPYVGGIIFDNVSSPGFLMGALWSIQLLAIIFSFSEPFRINGRTHTERKQKKEKKSLGAKLKETSDLIMRNPALPLMLFLFAYIEMICEVLISSCATICSTYFGWNGSLAGLLIACLGAFVLPAHLVVERTSRSFDERQIMKYSLIFIVICLCSVVNYEQVDHGLRFSSTVVKNKSVESWHVVKDTSVHDWNTVKDPQTWKDLWNETEKDWQSFEDMTGEEWNIFKNATIHEWEKLEEEGEEEWAQINEDAKLKYAQFANATQAEWIELRKDAANEWNNIVNGTEQEWEKLSDATKKELEALPNQTEEGWSKLNHGAREEWNKLGNQTVTEWEKIRNGTETMWNNIEQGTEHKLDQAKDAVSKASGAVAEQSGELRNATAGKWKQWSTDIASTLDHTVSNQTSKSFQNVGSRDNDQHGRLLSYTQFELLHSYDYGYGYQVYLIGISFIFMGVTILRGVDTSLMCKAAPSKLNSTFINVGLMATMIGALGRVLGNGLITLSALIPIQYADFVNCIFMPLIPISILGLYYMNRYYSSLI